MKFHKYLLILFYLQFYCTVISLVVDKTLRRPNIIFILTDDQDAVLGGQSPITKTKKLLAENGMTFTNTFVTTPLCCPSRSSILTGKYVHNHAALNNSLAGNCSSPKWQKNEETTTFAVTLQKNGYDTFFAGKYLNQYGTRAAGGVSHVPPGWSEWLGLVGNSKYYNYTLSVNGKKEVHGDNYEQDYLTDLIGRRAVKFLKSTTNGKKPFFLMLSTPACHAPFTSSPQYNQRFSNISSPRNGSYNKHAQDKHWLIRNAPNPMTKESVNVADDSYRKRWRTLLSVDDLVELMVNTVEDMRVMDNTYIVYASDNGYHFGQFSMPYDKRQLYEFDIRVPLILRGPNIPANTTNHHIALNIDLAPTFVDLATSERDTANMDGRSLVPLLHNESLVSPWRTDFMVEHSGEFAEHIEGCPQYNHQNMFNCYPSCVCEDSKNNTYSCVRTINKHTNMMYCQFSDKEDFVEVYDLFSDPDQLVNAKDTIDPKMLIDQNKRLVELSICAAVTCRENIQPWPSQRQPHDNKHVSISNDLHPQTTSFTTHSKLLFMRHIPLNQSDEIRKHEEHDQL